MRYLIIISIFFNLIICRSQIIEHDTLIITDNDYLRCLNILKLNDNYFISGFSQLDDTLFYNHNLKISERFNIIWENKIKEWTYRFNNYTYFDNQKNICNLKIEGQLIFELALTKIDTSGKISYQTDAEQQKKNNLFTNTDGLFIDSKKNIFHINGKGSGKGGKLLLKSFGDECKFQSIDTVYKLNDSLYVDLTVKKAFISKDGNLLVLGSFINGKKYINDTFVIKFDTNNRVIWECVIPSNPVKYFPGDICESKSGDIFVYGNHPKSPNYNYRDFFAKISKDGELIWIKNFSEDLQVNSVNTFESPNGDIYLLANSYQLSIPGGWNPPATYYNFSIIKTNPDGELLWRKTWGKDSCQNLLNDIVFENNNEFVVVGQQGKYTYLARIKDTTLTSVENSKFNKNALSLNPNPATNQIILNFYNLVAMQHIKIDIYNILGIHQKGVDILLNKGEINIPIDIGSLASGIYFVVFNNGNSIQKQMFVKE